MQLPADMPVPYQKAKYTDAPSADREVVYKVTPHGPLKMHWFFPPGWRAEDRGPAIVFFFGGGWRTGTPRQFFTKARYLTSRGLVAVSCEYRIRSLHDVIPHTCVQDATDAMRFVRGQAGQYGIDPDRLIASGGSAGGHLATCTAVCPAERPEGGVPDVSPKPSALVLFNPVLDICACEFLTDLPAKEQISPAEFASGGCPPAIMFFGTEDVWLQRGLGFIETAIAQGSKIQLWTAEGMPHAFFNRSPWHEATTILTDRFLVESGYLSGEPTMKPTDPAAQLRLRTVRGGSLAN